MTQITKPKYLFLYAYRYHIADIGKETLFFLFQSTLLQPTMVLRSYVVLFAVEADKLLLVGSVINI